MAKLPKSRSAEAGGFISGSRVNYCTEKLEPYGLPSGLSSVAIRVQVFHITYKAHVRRDN